ncbi:MAG: hypothetical protein ABFC34_16240 [Methanobacterium sp.]
MEAAEDISELFNEFMGYEDLESTPRVTTRKQPYKSFLGHEKSKTLKKLFFPRENDSFSILTKLFT